MEGKTCPRPPGRLRRSWRAFVVFAAAAGFVLGAAWPVSAALPSTWRKPEEFKTAIRAQDQGQWQTSVELIRLAIQKQPEDGKRVRISGNRYRSYLPHFYLGLALYKQGDCAGALKEWERSLKLGAVQTTEESATLRTYLSDCQAQRP